MILEAYTRIFVDADALQDTVDFYCAALGGTETLRFQMTEQELELSTISSEKLSLLIIAGAPQKRAPYEHTKLTLKVDDLGAHCDELKKLGASQVEEISATPVGWKCRFQHPDGVVVEYVEHKLP